MSAVTAQRPASESGVDAASLILLGLRPVVLDGWVVVLGGVHTGRDGLCCTVTLWPIDASCPPRSLLLRCEQTLLVGARRFRLVELTVEAVRCTAGATGELARFVVD